eukprot:GHVL01011694.1.p1 GENE.GHVL01011694.1~~GHVL01011694.1.p1  ORF type:complete len:205 (-),score=19.97 GHVL01011694.1:202-816(-)
MCCSNCYSCFDSAARNSISAFYTQLSVIFIGSGVLGIIGLSVVPEKLPNSSVSICPIDANIFVQSSCFLINGLGCVAVSWGFTYSEKVEDFESLTTTTTAVGFLVKVVPVWVRIIHLFNFGQIYSVILQLLLLPECDNSSIRWIMGHKYFVIYMNIYIYIYIYIYVYTYIFSSHSGSILVAGHIPWMASQTSSSSASLPLFSRP